ncbi:hypothetical protein EYC55_18905 [Xanthomonas oryzae]|uniref:Uncharacterized protein n=1 Tax=Xanthomonas oryzae pv. leersiae TaxID=3112258 RepID=A0AAJ6GWA0_9XANT|nr:hypothetical protein [Xanthomonas oryzae]QBG93270.1 hypothetical protein EYR26_19205 [Xanthomonas oryzae]QBG97074.1 hypothetical protein EYC55_18905 [Xanthomonas oryzae]UNE63383.1 hypothetical protein MML47_03670 [Xanthomonas oryzae]WIX07329.1 hypothetical protein QN060_04340 [Xanthomonas oryzae pv. oryzae]
MGSRFASELSEHVVDLPQQKLLPLPAPHQLQMDQSFFNRTPSAISGDSAFTSVDGEGIRGCLRHAW